MKMSYFTDDALEFDGALYKTPKIRTKGRGKLGKQLNKFILVDVKNTLIYGINNAKNLELTLMMSL